jgi:hypothetical protein
MALLGGRPRRRLGGFLRRVPKTVQLLGHTITVRIVSKRDWEALEDKYDDMEDTVGFWIADDNLIVLQRQPRSKLWHTYCHELMHAILHYANSHLTHDESFVDLTGALLAQALETAR